MYRVRFILQRPGYRICYLEGLYRPRGNLSVNAMRKACQEELRQYLEAQDPEYRKFDIKLTYFNRLRIEIQQKVGNE